MQLAEEITRSVCVGGSNLMVDSRSKYVANSAANRYATEKSTNLEIYYVIMRGVNKQLQKL